MIIATIIRGISAYFERPFVSHRWVFPISVGIVENNTALRFISYRRNSFGRFLFNRRRFAKLRLAARGNVRWRARYESEWKERRKRLGKEVGLEA